MKVRINNNEVETQATTVAELAQEQKLPEKGVAVAISNEMVPRTEWARHRYFKGILRRIINNSFGNGK